MSSTVARSATDAGRSGMGGPSYTSGLLRNKLLAMSSVYDFSATTLDGQDKALADYRGKVLLIVNVASKCGFTPQYEGLEALEKDYAAQGFEVLGFPCNQFGAQEPGDAAEIA